MITFNITTKVPAKHYSCSKGSSHPTSSEPVLALEFGVVTESARKTEHVELHGLEWSNGSSASPVLVMKGAANARMLRELADMLRGVARDMDRMPAKLRKLKVQPQRK